MIQSVSSNDNPFDQFRMTFLYETKKYYIYSSEYLNRIGCVYEDKKTEEMFFEEGPCKIEASEFLYED